MEYTDYGLWEGLAMVGVSIVLATLIYIIKGLAIKGRWKDFSLVYGLILLSITLDTLMWALNIQTNVIDFLYTSNGQTEQITIFVVFMGLLVLYMLFMGEKEEVSQKGEGT